MRQWVTYNMWVRMTERILDFWIIFFSCFLQFLWIFILGKGIRLFCLFLISDFHWEFFYLIFHFLFILHHFPYLINPLRAKYRNSFTHLLFAKSSWRLGREGEGERDGSFGVRECDEEERWIPLWCLNETFQNSKWVSVSLIHSDILCRPLQILQDQKARRKLRTWLTSSRWGVV